MIVESPDALRSWLTSTLEPICDADPAALAKYVMALLKKDRTEQELKEFCVDQLDVFLQKETKSFVDCLFQAVQSKCYLPAASSSVPTAPTAAAPQPPAPQTSSQPPTDTQHYVTSTTAPPPATANGGESTPSTTRPPPRKRISPPPRDITSKSEKHSSRSGRDRKASRSPQRDRTRRRGQESGGQHDVENSGVSSSGRSTRSRHNRDKDRRRPSRSRSPLRRNRTSRDNSPSGGGAKGKSEKEKESQEAGPPSSAKETSTLEVPLSTKDIVKKKKTRCRDYDEKGYCMRGDLCPFDHGPDPVVAPCTALPGMIATIGPSSEGPVTGPPPPNFSVPPPGYAPLNPPPPGVDPVAVTSYTPATTQRYNPESPALAGERPIAAVPRPAYTVPPPTLPAVTGVWSRPPPPVLPPYGFTRPPPSLGHKRELITLAEPPAMGGPPMMKRGRGIMDRLGPRPYGGHRAPYHGGGTGPGPVRPPMPMDNKTLEVRKVPPHMNNISKLNEHFQKFGQITNIQVRYEGDPEAALITYQTKNQATVAYKSTAPILNNRFIKVFWHTPKESPAAQEETGPSLRDRLGGGAATGGLQDTSMVEPPKTDNDGVQKTVMVNAKGSLTRVLHNPGALAAAAARQHHHQHQHVPMPGAVQAMRQQEYAAAKKQRRQEREKNIALLQLQSKKNSLLTKQLEQQKLVLKQIEKTKDDKQKKELMKMMKSLKTSSKQLLEEVKELNEKLGEVTRLAQERDSKTKEEVEKEKLDLELELMNQSQAGEDVTDLHKRLTDIKQQLILLAKKEEAEGVKIGGPLKSSTPVQAVGRRGSGHKTVIPQTSRLDKRPRNVTVEGFGPEEKDAIIQHLRELGEMEDLEFDMKGKDGGCRALVLYKTRHDAERAVSTGGEFKEDRKLIVGWGVEAKGEGEERGSETGTGLETDGATDGDGAPLTARRHRMSASELLASLGDDSDDSDQGKEDFLEDDDEEEEEEEKEDGRRGRR